MRGSGSWWGAWSSSRPARGSWQGWWGGGRKQRCTRHRGRPRARWSSLHDRHRHEAPRERAVAELAKAVGTPAVGQTTGRHAAAVRLEPGAHASEVQASGDRHRARPVDAARPIAELTEVVSTPAVCGRTRGHPAGVELPGAHPRERESARDGRRRLAGVARGAVAQPAGAVPTPAVRRRARGHAAVVVDPRAHRPEVGHTDDGHQLQGPLDYGPIAQLTLEVPAPAERRAARGHAAGVAIAGTDGREVAPADDRYGAHPTQHGAIPELPSLVVAPAVHLATRGHAAGVAHARIDHREGEPPEDPHAARTIQQRPVSQLP